MSDAINWMLEIEDVKEKSHDPLADAVMDRFNGAVSWQSTELVNGKPLRTVLENCWNQQNGIMSCDTQERAKALGVDAYINLTALKADIANSYLNDAMTSSGDASLPWTVVPTPRPDISPVAQDEIFNEIKAQLQSGSFEDASQLIEAIRQQKREMHFKETEKAKKSADAMMLLLADQCAEGGFNRALTDFLQWFPIYPFAVFAGPYITRAPRLVWGKNKPRIDTEVFPTFRAISPFDFAYSPDSPDTQRGTCIFTRTRWTRRELLNASKLDGYIAANIKDILKQADDPNVDFNLSWLSRAPDEGQRNMALWSSNVSPIEVLTHYGLMSGRELQKYDIQGLDDGDFYNCQISLVQGRVIEVRVFSDPKIQTRPVYTASFYRTGGDRIAGDGIAQRLRDIERAYMASLMYLMRNAANASAPICEADYRRIASYIGKGELGQIVPGSLYLSDSDLGNNNMPAFRFTNIPSNIPAYAQLMEMFMQLADRVTNIPAALHGEAVGSGAMRTFRGMSMLQGNATKALHAAADNIAYGVFKPLGELLYNTNMLFAKDMEVKGDSHILTKGAEGLLKKEMEKQSAMEILQTVGAAAGALGQAVNLAPVISWSLKTLLGTMGVPDNVLGQMEQMSPMGVMPGAGSAPNPAPPSPTGAGVTADITGGEA